MNFDLFKTEICWFQPKKGLQSFIKTLQTFGLFLWFEKKLNGFLRNSAIQNQSVKKLKLLKVKRLLEHLHLLNQ